MKKDIHPKYNDKMKAICACGYEFETGSILPEIKTELCSMCHPFYTGKQKLVDTARRVEKFKDKQKTSKEVSQQRKGKKVKYAAKTAAKKEGKAEKAEKKSTKK
jgi:large subunit ribosomal protein L31